MGVTLTVERQGVCSDEYIQLMSRCFNRHFSEAWFKWFNHACPSGKSRIYSVREGGEFISTVCFLPITVKLGDSHVLGSIYVNAMTHPAYQKKGLNFLLLSHALSDAKNRGDQISITFPFMHRYSMKGMLKTGWMICTDVHFFVLLRIPLPVHHAAFRVNKFPPGAEALIKQYYEGVRFGIVKEVDFMNWRITERPDQSYEIYLHGRELDPDGLIVLKHFMGGRERKTHIMEIIACKKEVTEDLLRTAENRAAEEGSVTLNLWCSQGDVMRNALERYGFVRTEEKNILLVQKHQKDDEKVEMGEQIHFSLADNDVY